MKGCEFCDMSEGEFKDIDIPGIGPRIAISIIAGIGWLVFLLVYLAFWSGGHTVIQGLVIIIVSVLAVGAIMGVTWATWGMKFKAKEKMFKEHVKEHKGKKK